MRRYTKFVDLGGDNPCPCHQIFEAFNRAFHSRKPELEELPEALHDFIVARLNHRQTEWGLSPIDVHERWMALQNLCWWRRPDGLERLLNHVLHRKLGVPEDVRCHVTWDLLSPAYRFELTSEEKLLVDVDMDPDWVRNVYQRGIAVFQGNLVLGFWEMLGTVFNDPSEFTSVRLVCFSPGPDGTADFDVKHSVVAAGLEQQLQACQVARPCVPWPEPEPFASDARFWLRGAAFAHWLASDIGMPLRKRRGRASSAKADSKPPVVTR
jgi:hypothetical protein